MTEKGKVWLAGAGPGDAGLLTVKTRQLLCESDLSDDFPLLGRIE